MTKKELITPIAIILLSVVFAIICIAVFLTKGKSSFWISKKFRIGAMLLTFTSVMACKPTVTCYEPMPSDWITLDSINWETSELNIDSSENEKITGKISGATDSVYSYNFADTIGNVLVKNNLQIKDGTFDEFDEEFEILETNSLNTGLYVLQFYKKNKDNQNDTNFVNSFNVRISE